MNKEKETADSMIITGTSHWFKALGTPRPNKFNPDVPQWAFDLSVDADTAQTLLKAGMKKTYLRNKDDERGTFITFTRDAVKKDGKAGKPISVVDSKKQPWPADTAIGNGSILNVVVSLNERTFRGEKFLKPSVVAVQVWDLVRYDSGAFSVKEDDGSDAEPISKEANSW